MLNPGEVGQGNPDRLSVDCEANVGGVGVARGDSDDGALPEAMELLAGEAVPYREVFVHGYRLEHFRRFCGLERSRVVS
jgi:hypothetical protein